ncbi:MAG: hypothetical protein C5B52_09935 [Bacteroidetes bacterium]|nr:MAG: hypothetical protein C5B52_09935 [Bacteroidota bacterium]
MKRLSVLFACFLLISSCNKFQKEFEDQTNKLTTVKDLHHVTTGVSKMILINAGKQILLLNKSVDSLADNLYDRAIVLASETNFKEPGLRWQKFDGRLYFFNDERSVLIHRNCAKAILMSLDEPEGTRRVKIISSALSLGQASMTVLAGYGLSIMKGRWNTDKMLSRDFENAFEMLNYGFSLNGWVVPGKGPEAWAFKDPKCDSGGAGSESCTVKASNPIGGVECSVKCKTGFYACCENATTNCTCKKDPVTLN